MTDWWNLGSTAVPTTAFHTFRSAAPVPVPVSLYASTVALDPARQLVSVTLPTNAQVHLFDLQAR
jgi:hypothetical protein